MNKFKHVDDKLIEELNMTLKNFDDFQEAKINLHGDITIKRRNTSKRIKERSVLTDVFKQMISNDIKKNRV